MNTNGPPPTSGPVTITITPSSNYEIMGSPSNTVEIYSIGGPEPWINVFRRVDPVGNTLNEGGSKGQFVVSRYYAYPNGPPPQSIPTPPPLPDFALGGTARAGLDYIATKQATLRVLPAIASSMVFVDGYEVEITPLEDSAYDGGEWVDFALIPNEQSIVPIAEGSTPSFVTLPISDTGTPPKPQISITAPDPNSSELATSSGMYRIMRNDVNLPQTLTINYAFDPTGLTDPATFSDDYSATSGVGGLASSGSLTFPAGVAMIEVKLTPADDSKLENDELAQLKLLPGINYVVDAMKALAMMLIVDKEEKPQIVITSSSNNTVIINANNDNWKAGGAQKQWISASQKYIPAVRDFDAANLWQDDPQIEMITVTIKGRHAGTLTAETWMPGEGKLAFWEDKRKKSAFSSVDIEGGIDPISVTFFVEGQHESIWEGDAPVLIKLTSATNPNVQVTRQIDYTVLPIVSSFATVIPTPSVKFINNTDSKEGMIAYNQVGDVGDPRNQAGIQFNAITRAGSLPVGFVQNVMDTKNGANGSAAGAVNTNALLNQNWLPTVVSGNIYPGAVLDSTNDNETFYPAFPPINGPPLLPGYVMSMTKDNPGVPATSVNSNTMVVYDVKYYFKMYLVVQFTDGSIYSFSSLKWNANFYATRQNAANTFADTVNAASGVSADGYSVEDNENPLKTVGPVANNTEWR